MEYMKGAITEPCVKNINVPINNIVIIKGANQYFFLTFKKSQISPISSNKASIIKKSFQDILYYLFEIHDTF